MGAAGLRVVCALGQIGGVLDVPAGAVYASGITVLQVAANPLVTLIGDPDTASSRLNMTQAFNSLGTTVAPIIGGILIFGAAGEGGASNVVTALAGSADTVILPYLTLAAILVLLALFSNSVAYPTTIKEALTKATTPPITMGRSSNTPIWYSVLWVFSSTSVQKYLWVAF